MSTDRLTSVPSAIFAGDTCRLTLTFADFAAPTWDLSWSIAGPDVLTVASVDNDAAHDLTLTAEQTAGLGPGNYSWRIRATDGTETITVQTGTIAVEADLAALAPGEGVSFAAKNLPVVEAAINGTLSAEMQSYMIGTRQVQMFSLKELYALRARLRTELQREQNGGTLPSIIMGRWPRNDAGVWT